MRNSRKFNITDIPSFKKKLLHWTSHHSTFAFLNSNNETEGYECIVATGKQGDLFSAANSFEGLKDFYDSCPDWLFGYFSYDLKNEIEDLRSENFDGLKFPGLYFFQPELVITLKGHELEIHSRANEQLDPVVQEIGSCSPDPRALTASFRMQQRITEQEYLASVERIRQHIHRGDIYEMNFCMEFFAEHAECDPCLLYERLNEISQTPFSAFCRFGDKYLACASPERFLKKTGKKLVSQPIKGTAPRGASEKEDEILKLRLRSDKKEQSENVMIVDLVRNDLSRVCTSGTVKADELFGIYTFRQVHQMISTVSGELRDDVHVVDAIKNMFPMGSMTGAPKVRAMQLIEQYERTKRGLFSGAVGYITPGGDLDLNVVIRSILYNASEKYLSFSAGSAITANCNAEKEYEECMLKAKAMFEVLS